QLFYFSATDSEVIEELKNLQGHAVRLSYEERFRTFPWWGDTRYFITKVEETQKGKEYLEE
ncbi:MAG: hypothetical protein U9N85_07095, partial [Bacteroidota bacterium]|nr:hypothetical protein [Bacteroidota bacterium]